MVWALWETVFCAVFQVPRGRVLRVHRDDSVGFDPVIGLPLQRSSLCHVPVSSYSRGSPFGSTSLSAGLSQSIPIVMRAIKTRSSPTVTAV